MQSEVVDQHWRDDLRTALGAGACGVALNAFALAPSVTFGGDCGELSAAVSCWGVPHPTGYPLYLLLAKAVTWLLPVGDVAWRVAFFSCLCGGVAVGLVALLVARLTGDRAASILAALGLQLAPAFWSQAVIAEVYALHVALLAGLLVLHLEWSRSGDRRWLNLLGLGYGLALCHHVSAVLLAPGTALFVLLSEAGEGRLRRTLAALGRVAGWALPGLLLYAYLPLRASLQPPICWGETDTASGLLAHVTGRDYGNLFVDAPRDVLHYAANHLLFLALDLRWTAVLALLGLVAAWRWWRPVLGLLLVGGGAALAFAAGYRVGDRTNYVLPCYLYAAVLSGLGVAGLRQRLIPAWREEAGVLASFGCSALLLVVVPMFPSPPDGAAAVRAGWERSTMRGDDRGSTLAQAVLDEVDQGAALLVLSDELAQAAWYQQVVGGRRRDVTVYALGTLRTPKGKARCERWLARELPRREVFTAFYSAELADRYDLEMRRVTCRLRPQPQPRQEDGGGGWKLVAAAAESPVTRGGLPAVKPRTMGRVATRWQSSAGAGSGDVVVVAMHETVAAAQRGEQVDGPRVVNDSSGTPLTWWATRFPSGPDEAQADYPLALPEWALPGRYEVRVGRLAAGDEAAWRRIESDPAAAWAATEPAGAVVTFQR